MRKTLFTCLLLSMGIAALAQLQNPDFEQWENPPGAGAINRPVGWIRSNGVPMSETYGFYHTAATDSNSGDFALKLSIWYTYDKDFAYQVAPINSRPAALTGYYKYTDNLISNGMTGTNTEDSASAKVYLTRWNDDLQQTDTIGVGEVFLSGRENYTAFNCPITYSSDEMPDTVKVLLDCSLMTKGEESNGHTTALIGGVGSIFTVDGLAFSQSLNTSSVTAPGFALYPNPAENMLYLSGFEGAVTIHDAAGRKVSAIDNYSGAGIETEKFQAGAYFITLTNASGKEDKTFVKR